MLQGLPQETRSKLFVPWQLQVLPWTAYVLIGLGIVCMFVQAISVYVMEKKSDVFSVYGHLNIIPQLFHKVKLTLLQKNHPWFINMIGYSYFSAAV